MIDMIIAISGLGLGLWGLYYTNEHYDEEKQLFVKLGLFLSAIIVFSCTFIETVNGIYEFSFLGVYALIIVGSVLYVNDRLNTLRSRRIIKEFMSQI